jgi:hypothetical protein
LNQDELHEKTVASMMGKGALTIPDVLNHLSMHGLEVDGDEPILLDEFIVLWLGVSADAVAAVRRLWTDTRVEKVDPGPWTVAAYMMDGSLPALPQVTESGLSKGPGHYKTPHWLPMELRVNRPSA